ncbi:PREDICTED: uncharacterized protein LOC106316009 isoform X2 [Brassica oleracea var. oleracea]|uniref:uncharacterized protein LOC106316009 isoform X2 n=1 Tax=Brassica oleracea var. oleracea TaxID=109376 RepID=UPI0006A6B75E|nr:PREDICTED: uncharacterized protein LOC106316009 isoform X2 [Brassica oleracea var. oleracea]
MANSKVFLSDLISLPQLRLDCCDSGSGPGELMSVDMLLRDSKGSSRKIFHHCPVSSDKVQLSGRKRLVGGVSTNVSSKRAKKIYKQELQSL